MGPILKRNGKPLKHSYQVKIIQTSLTVKVVVNISITIKVNPLTFGINSSEHREPICKVGILIASLWPVDCCMLFRIMISVPEIAGPGPLVHNIRECYLFKQRATDDSKFVFFQN